MTDKKQIIIDGVDVGDCEFYGSQENCIIRAHQNVAISQTAITNNSPAKRRSARSYKKN